MSWRAGAGVSFNVQFLLQDVEDVEDEKPGGGPSALLARAEVQSAVLPL